MYWIIGSVHNLALSLGDIEYWGGVQYTDNDNFRHWVLRKEQDNPKTREQLQDTNFAGSSRNLRHMHHLMSTRKCQTCIKCSKTGPCHQSVPVRKKAEGAWPYSQFRVDQMSAISNASSSSCTAFG